MQGRSHHITGKSKLLKMMQSYEQFRVDELLPVSHEIVYGHAWVAEAKTNESVVVSFKKI